MKKVLHSTSSKSPHDLVDRAAACASRITDTASERQQEELAKYLALMKVRAPPFIHARALLFTTGIWPIKVRSRSAHPIY